MPISFYVLNQHSKGRVFIMQKNDQFQVTDERKMPFTMVENGIIDSMSFEKPIDKLLYISISRFSHMKEIYPSIGTLMLMCGISSPNTFKAALKRLKSLKILDYKDRGRKENGEHYTHQYILKEVPGEILENSVFKIEKVQEKKAEIKEARKEKAKKTKHNQHKKQDKSPADQASEKGTSKFDGGSSKNDGGASKFDGGPSKFEQEEKESIKQESTNQELTNKEYLSILKKVKALNIPSRTVSMLEEQIDRLMLHKIKPIEIELAFNQFKDQMGHEDFNSVLYDVLQAKKFNSSFKKYLEKSLNTFLANRLNKEAAAGQPKQPIRTEMIPAHMEDQQEQVKDQEQIEKERQELEEMLKAMKENRKTDQQPDHKPKKSVKDILAALKASEENSKTSTL